MAMTVGVRARLGGRSGMMRSASASADAWRTHALDSGTHTSGAAPELSCHFSLARAVTISGDSLEEIATDPQTPLTFGFVWAQSLASLAMIVWIRGATTTLALALPEHESFFSRTTPAVTPPPSTSTTAMTSTVPSGNRRRGPPRRCDRTDEVRPDDGMGGASEGGMAG